MLLLSLYYAAVIRMLFPTAALPFITLQMSWWLVDTSLLQNGLQGSLKYCRAYWPSKYIIAWNFDVGNGSYYLFASKTASLMVTDAGIQGLLSMLYFSHTSTYAASSLVIYFLCFWNDTAQWFLHYLYANIDHIFY